MTVAEAIALDERRAARAAWQRSGGSRRRPLRSFVTSDEKRERRQEHAARISEALERLETPEGARDWIEARELNPDVSPLNQALIALQAPGEIVGTLAAWKRNGTRVRKGERGSVFLTAPGFWPRPAFTAAQTDAPPELADPEPVPVEGAERVAAELREHFARHGRKGKVLTDWAA